MFIVAVTGGIASGKSTVSMIFSEKGIPVIDSDVIAREIVEPGSKAWTEIREHFGSKVFNSDSTLNRKALAEIVFNDAEKRRILNGITHPKIQKKMFWELVKCFFKGYQMVVVDVPLLFETRKILSYVDKVITVYCDEETQLERLQKRMDMTEEEAKKRIAAQMPLKEKCDMSDFVIDNTGPRENTKEETEKIIQYLQSLNLHWENKLRMFLLSLAILVFLGVTLGGFYLLLAGKLKVSK
ncbi:dephospho-CoA kinase domain-containing protein-like [Artemia franciscana]|uniref:Dephospho-CoA kinase domain-containing protein n=1 Tax=Artemia franciscana TaxID=6661 RepID=A0AA88L4P6_ARTSF|nr:hypothetical protein QYM36_006982 [Artemia franciscana]